MAISSLFKFFISFPFSPLRPVSQSGAGEEEERMENEEAVQVTISVPKPLVRLIEDHLQPYGFGGYPSVKEYVEACVKAQIQADLDNLYSDREEVLRKYGVTEEMLDP